MLELILDCALDALKDGALSIPILFIAYLLMELLERSKRMDESVLRSYSAKAGPAVGGLLGAVPQCGISGAAATLFSTGAITVGTMLAVFFATSDEMLPVMLSSLTEENGIGIGQIAGIVAAKAGLGIALGYAVDALFGRRFARDKNIHDFCEREHCECEDEEGSALHAALVHTVKIAVMLIAVGFALGLILELVGAERLSASVFSRPVTGELLLALLGLIPNCAVSVIITQAYLTGIVGLGGLFAGLLSNAGIGMLVLFRTNRDMKENLSVVAISYVLSAITGIVIGMVL
ncbi:MAG: arsenic efflux protein [Oscillospiraceae bacterium]|nr:arsenic efflux protein [Oscillospiraceae bacterium]